MRKVRNYSLFLLSFFMFLSAETNLFSQSEFDSLVQLIPSTKKADIPKLYNAIAKSLVGKDAAKATSYAHEALTEAAAQKNEPEKARAYYNIGAALYNAYKYDSALSHYHIAFQYFTHLNLKNEAAATNNNMGLVFKEKNDYKQALAMHNNALSLYSSVSDNKGLAQTYNYKGNLFLRQSMYDSALTNYRLTLDLRQRSGNINEIVSVLINLGSVCRDMGRFDDAERWFEQGLKATDESKDIKQKASIYHYLGGLYWKQKQYLSSMRNFLNALQIRTELNDILEAATTQQNIGILYKDLGNYDKALEYFNNALHTYELNGDKKKTSVILNYIGNTYMAKGEALKAIENYKNSLEIKEAIGDKKEIAQLLNNIGSAYIDAGQIKKAYENFTRALSVSRSIGDRLGIMNAFNNLGNYYQKTGNNTEALRYFNDAYSLAIELHDDFTQGLCARKKGELLLASSNNDEALKWIEQSLSIGTKTKHNELIKKARYALYEFYNKIGNLSLALENYKAYSEANDSIDAEQRNTKVIEAQMSYEVENKVREINKLERERSQERTIHELELSKQKNLRNSFIVIGLLLLLIAVVIYNRFLFQKRMHNELQEANKKLVESEENLKRLNGTKDKFFSIIAHDIKNPLGGIMGLSELVVKEFDELSDEEIKKFAALMHANSKSLYSLLENLLQWSKSQMGTIRFEPEKINLDETIEQIISIFQLNANKKEITLESNLQENLAVKADKDMVSAIIRNMVSNAIKFTRNGGKVVINTSKKDNEILVSVSDNGVGMTAEELGKIFRIDMHFTSLGTQSEAGTGLGLILCKEFVERHGGRIWVESEPEKGSRFFFTLPVSA
jgi:signal transduction histidine kinase/tetratricopeptide (TPR) repeat protein